MIYQYAGHMLGRSDAEASARLLFAAAVAVLVAATIFETIGYRPCELCLIERMSWYFTAPAALLALAALRLRRAGIGRAILLLIAAVLLFNTGLAGYHAGMEWGWWEGPASCTGAVKLALDPADLLARVQSEQVVRCDVAEFRLFGLSFAGYDVLLSLACAALALIGARDRAAAAA